MIGGGLKAVDAREPEGERQPRRERGRARSLRAIVQRPATWFTEGGFRYWQGFGSSRAATKRQKRP